MSWVKLHQSLTVIETTLTVDRVKASSSRIADAIAWTV